MADSFLTAHLEPGTHALTGYDQAHHVELDYDADAQREAAVLSILAARCFRARAYTFSQLRPLLEDCVRLQVIKPEYSVTVERLLSTAIV